MNLLRWLNPRPSESWSRTDSRVYVTARRRAPLSFTLLALCVAASLLGGTSSLAQASPQEQARGAATGLSGGCIPVPGGLVVSFARMARLLEIDTANHVAIVQPGLTLAELDALTMAYNAVQQGAAGVDMGRNIFQSAAPQAMIAAINAVVHKNTKPKEAYDMFSALKAKG